MWDYSNQQFQKVSWCNIDAGKGKDFFNDTSKYATFQYQGTWSSIQKNHQ